jgi:uncharacterized YigZ family protein
MLFEDEYKTIDGPSQGLYKDKGSKFIAHAFPCRTVEDAKAHLEQVKKEYHDARHHCYAYILGFDKSEFRMNDDGEPSGTAGKPIYGQLLSYDLTNVLVVVVRYFGGTKLGVRGLINAYKFATQDAIQNNVIVTKVIRETYRLTFNYADMNHVMRIMKEEGLKQTGQDFQMTCTLDFSVRKKNAERVVKRFEDLRKVKVEYLNRN